MDNESINEKKKITILMTSDALNKAVSALQIAIKGAEMGFEVNIFFMSCGMKVIKKNPKLYLAGMLMPFTFIAKSRLKKLGIGSLKDLIEKAIESGVNFYGCKTCASFIGIKEKKFIKEVKLVSIEKYIELALSSDIQLTLN